MSIFSYDPTDTKLYPLDCSCLSHCSFEDGMHSHYIGVKIFDFIVGSMQSCLCLSGVLPRPHAGSNYLLALLDPLSSMLQMLQECSQLELALRVLVNSFGSCLQHVISNVMDTKLSVQVWLQHQVLLLVLMFWNRYTVYIL